MLSSRLHTRICIPTQTYLTLSLTSLLSPPPSSSSSCFTSPSSRCRVKKENQSKPTLRDRKTKVQIHTYVCVPLGSLLTLHVMQTKTSYASGQEAEEEVEEETMFDKNTPHGRLKEFVKKHKIEVDDLRKRKSLLHGIEIWMRQEKLERATRKATETATKAQEGEEASEHESPDAAPSPVEEEEDEDEDELGLDDQVACYSTGTLKYGEHVSVLAPPSEVKVIHAIHARKAIVDYSGGGGGDDDDDDEHGGDDPHVLGVRFEEVQSRGMRVR